MLQEEKSKLFINILRGFAIFLMFWGHCIQYCSQDSFNFFNNAVFKVIYSFHMPLFMIISGYLFYYSFSKRNLKELIIHRSKPLLWTIIACGAFNYIITTGVIGIYKNRTISHFFNGSLIAGYGSLWFLWSVLSSALGVAIICKKVKNVGLQILLLILWTAVVYAFPNGTLNVYVYPYFVIGFYFAQYKFRTGGGCHLIETIIKIVSVIIFVVMLFFFQEKHYIYTTGLYSKEYSFLEHAGIDVFRWIIGLVGCICVISVIQLLFNFITLKSEKALPISTGLSKVGGKSLQMYALSVSLLSSWLNIIYAEVIKFAGYNILAHNMILYNFVYTPILSILYLLVIYLLIRLIEKSKLSKVLFGK